MVGWLFGTWLASMVGALIVVRIFEYIFGGVTGGVADIARTVLFRSHMDDRHNGVGDAPRHRAGAKASGGQRKRA